jgi:hypothetical protein
MRERRSWMVIMMLLVWTALYLVAVRSAQGQAWSPSQDNIIRCCSTSLPCARNR